MDTAVLAARILLAAVFAVAGIAKLLDRDGSREALRGFAVPERLVRPVAAVLPIAELAIALALVPAATARWAALAAAALLGIFSFAIARSMAQGRAPDCHCFGQLHSEPVGAATLVRNNALTGVALFAFVAGGSHPGADMLGWVGNLDAGEILAVVGGIALLSFLAFQTWFSTQLLRQNGRLLARLEAIEQRLGGAGQGPKPGRGQEDGLAVGQRVLTFEVDRADGTKLTSADLIARGRPVLLLFTDAACAPCEALLPEIGGWQREHGDRLSIAVLSRGDPGAIRAKSEEHGLANVGLLEFDAMSRALGVVATPGALLVSPDWLAASRPALGPDAIRELVRAALAGEIPMPAAPADPVIAVHRASGARNGEARAAAVVGEEAASFTLPGLEGEVSLEDYAGSELFLLFWNPGCGFCSQILGELRAWDASRTADDPELVIVSTGPPEHNRDIGLRGRVALDATFSVGHSVGARGTPGAVLLDSSGRISSEVASGAPAVLELLSSRSRDIA
jgi:peroxiredoxin/uncharacterized membrane protein YphA (DoxX/SURF4 family)